MAPSAIKEPPALPDEDVHEDSDDWAGGEAAVTDPEGCETERQVDAEAEEDPHESDAHDLTADGVKKELPRGAATRPKGSIGTEHGRAAEAPLERGDTRDEGLADRLRRRVGSSVSAQMGLFGVAGAAFLICWIAIERIHTGVKAAPPVRVADLETHASFPRLEVKGLDRVKEEDVEALLRAQKKAAETKASPETATHQRERLIQVRPGMMLDENVPRGVVVFDPERASPQTPPQDRPRPPGARFFAPGGLLSGAVPKRRVTEEVLGLRTGDRFRVRLDVGIVSSVHEEVIARVAEDVVRDGRPFMSKDDVVRGHASSDDKRIFIRFQSVETAGRTLRVSAYAVEGDMPGLRARRRAATFEERSQKSATGAVVTGAAREAGAILAEGSVIGRIAQGAASGVASEAQRDMRPDTSWVLEVSAGRTFEVVITEAK
jgi:hypothetical protein